MPIPLSLGFFRTLGHPARIRVLELLSGREHAVHELLEQIEIEPSNLSQQLAVLRRAGLVSQRRAAGTAQPQMCHKPLLDDDSGRRDAGRKALTCGNTSGAGRA